MRRFGISIYGVSRKIRTGELTPVRAFERICEMGAEVVELVPFGFNLVETPELKGEMKAASRRMGKKDIIKVDSEISLNLDVLGYISPEITVNVIKDGKNVKKYHPELPERIVDIVKCRNPRCITTTEQELPHIFKLTDSEARIYRCIYCESKAKD